MRRVTVPSLRRIIRWAILLVVLVLVVTNCLLPVGVAVFVVIGVDRSVGEPPEGFAEVALVTSDNVAISAWYIAPQNGVAIILIHGAGGTRDSVRDEARLLADNGYGVLAIDLRGHGESGGNTNKLGWDGTLDVGAAVAFLGRQTDVTAIGGLGTSLGGEVLLGAASAYPAIAAIVSDGATHRTFEEFYDLPAHRGVLRAIAPWIFDQTVGLLSGDERPLPIMDSLEATVDARFLLIAAGDVSDEGKYNTLFAGAVPGRAEVWVAPDVGHTGGFERYPEEYAERVLDFFDTVLLDE
jgi:pimeloyl-ACP methyl ester carboxylesterase